MAVYHYRSYFYYGYLDCRRIFLLSKIKKLPMQSNWKILPEISDDFAKRYKNYNRIILQLSANRRLITDRQIEKFLYPDFQKDLLDPFLFKKMAAACDLIIKHIKSGSNLTVYGDYDADGVTAAAVLVEILKSLGAKVNVYIPARVTEGYGLNKKAIDELVKAKVKLIITVDTGIRNKEEVNYAKNSGLDIIITDHHTAPKEKDLPDCLIINPMVENFPEINLAGVGVSFKLAKALITKSKLDEEKKDQLTRRVLDLVAVGTVADCVSLLGENRILVSEGLKILNQQNRVGLNELMAIAQIVNLNKKINALNIGWQIAPRLNSAGRLDHANVAYELLITNDKKEAHALSVKLNEKNKERQKITDEILERCKIFIDKNLLEDKILVIYSEDLQKIKNKCDWCPEGVIGLVAGRLCDFYSRPALVITKSNDEIKGSGRSIDEFDIIKAVERLKKYFSRFGGHAKACGFTFKNGEKEIAEFTKAIKALVQRQLKNIELRPKIMIEKELAIEEIEDSLVSALEKFEPFGEDNPRPKFVSRNLEIRDKIVMGTDGQHVKFRLGNFWAVAFSQADKWQELRIGDQVDAVYYLERNEFNGRSELQMKIVDIKLNNENTA